MEHIINLLTNHFVIVLLTILFFGEKIPATKFLWKYIGKKIKKFGEWFLNSYENKIYKTKSEWINEKEVKLSINNFFAKILFFTIATIVVILIEIFWELGFRKATKKLEKSNFAIWSEQQIKKLHPYTVLVLFGLPFIIMEFIGILAFISIASSHIYLGIGLYIFKVFFFIPVHFVLHQGEEQLMSIEWFKIRYNMIISLLEWFKKSQSYVRVHNISETIKGYMKAFKKNFFNRVVLIKKAFDHGEALSPKCQLLFDEISKKKNNNQNIDNQEYIDFFNCIENHISENNEEK
jgi:hypothetical protein